MVLSRLHAIAYWIGVFRLLFLPSLGDYHFYCL